MSAPTRIAAAAALVLLLALAGGLGWQRMRPSSSEHAEMLASAPPVTHGAPEATATPQPRAAAPDVAAKHESAPQPSPGSSLPDVPRTEPATPPSFDIVRVEPSGEALLAGHGKPNGTVALVDRGKVVAEAKADAGGNFVMTPPALKPGDYALSLREGQGAAAQESKQSVVVSVPASKKQQVVVALAEPGKATTLLSAPPEPAAAAKATEPAPATAKASAAPPKLAIRSVELENGSGLFASGIAPPGTDVRVYLNDSRVADVIAAAAGAWTVNVRKGLTVGRYAVRADSLKPDQSVIARVEVPFEVPAAAAPVPATPPQVGEAGPSADPLHAAVETPVPPRSSAADAVVDELKTELVTRGDNLWHISRKRLGHGTRYTEIYVANAAQIRDPKLVYPGQVFVLPHE